jgi:hypothetical protein
VSATGSITEPLIAVLRNPREKAVWSSANLGATYPYPEPTSGLQTRLTGSSHGHPPARAPASPDMAPVECEYSGLHRQNILSSDEESCGGGPSEDEQPRYRLHKGAGYTRTKSLNFTRLTYWSATLRQLDSRALQKSYRATVALLAQLVRDLLRATPRAPVALDGDMYTRRFDVYGKSKPRRRGKVRTSRDRSSTRSKAREELSEGRDVGFPILLIPNVPRDCGSA